MHCVLQQGKRSTESFLRYYVVKHNPPLKESEKSKQTSSRQSQEITNDTLNPVYSVSAHVQNGATNGHVTRENHTQITADINVIGIKDDIELNNIHTETIEAKEDAPIDSEIKEDTPIVSEDKQDITIVSDIKQDTPIVSEVQHDTPIVSKVKEDTPLLKEDSFDDFSAQDTSKQHLIIEEYDST